MGKIGFIGLGIMGKPMAKNLLKGGFDVMVTDLNHAAVEELEALGASSGTYAQLAENCEYIFTILPTPAIVQEVIFGENGLAGHLKSGQVVCDMSSVTPGDSQLCYNGLKKLGVGFVDAPVSGGEPGAIAGTLAIMCGGDQADFDRLLPAFRAMGSSAMLIGGSGAGSVTKLANQIMVNLNIAAVSEAMVLAAKAGVDPMKVYKAVRGGLAGSTVLDNKAPMMCARNFKPGGTIKVNHKDIKNVLATAHELDVPLPLTAQLFEIQQALKVNGHFMDDHAGYVQYFEKLAGVVVKSDETAE